MLKSLAAPGLHATTGPNMILFDADEDWEGPYTTKATFTMTKLASHEVAYGLFVGGQDLDNDKQRYTYFVIRQDGKYLIRKRTGATVTNVAGDWADHAAIQKPNAQGSQTNELAIQVGRDTVTFLANGQTVATQPAKAVDAVGISGLRIGHGLDGERRAERLQDGCFHGILMSLDGPFWRSFPCTFRPSIILGS